MLRVVQGTVEAEFGGSVVHFGVTAPPSLFFLPAAALTVAKWLGRGQRQV